MLEERQAILMRILEELWHGKINPHGRNIQKGSLTEQVLSLVVENDNAMRAMLTDKQKEQYEKLQSYQNELMDLLERESFTEGFCLAVKIMMEVMNTMEIPSADN